MTSTLANDKNKQTIFVLVEYNWLQASLIKTNKTTFKVEFTVPGCLSQIKNIKKEKCAFPDENVCIVWETWKGTNGRGGYRVERILYPQQRIAAQNISRQSDGPGRVTE